MNLLRRAGWFLFVAIWCVALVFVLVPIALVGSFGLMVFSAPLTFFRTARKHSRRG